MTSEDRDAIIQIINEVLAASGLQTAVPVAPAKPTTPITLDPEEPDGPFSAGITALYRYMTMAEQVDDIAAQLNWRFTRSDVYTTCANVIERAIRFEMPWAMDSKDSWRWTAEAYRTRAAELSGDKITTAVPQLAVLPGPPDFGVGERTLNALDLIVRAVVSQYDSAHGDKDLGAGGEPISTGECVRLTYVVLDRLIKTSVLPPGGAFGDVRMELYNQYTAMGEGVFGPINIPGGPVPWSWAGGGK